MTMKVWVVDDDESIRWVLERALQAGGMAVQTFPGAVEVLDALEQARPDVVMTDIRMKGIDGLELLSRVHAVLAFVPVAEGQLVLADLDSRNGTWVDDRPTSVSFLGLGEEFCLAKAYRFRFQGLG